MMYRLSATALAALSCLLLVAVTGPGDAVAKRAPIAPVTPGEVLGGITSQRLPVVLEVNPRGVNRVIRASVAIALTCSGGARFIQPDEYTNLSVTKRGRFKASFGPQTQQVDEDTTVDLQGSVQGRFNSARTRASGTWQFKGIEHDTAGAVTDTCDSGRVTWRAKQ